MIYRAFNWARFFPSGLSVSLGLYFAFLVITVIFLEYLLLGAFAGFLAGLFGVGGGLIIVPALIFMFQAQGMPAELITYMALATSLVTIIFTNLSALRVHHQAKVMDWTLVKRLVPGMVFGSLSGGLWAGALSGDWLNLMLAGFIWLMAASIVFDWQPKQQQSLPTRWPMLCFATLIGILSAIFGIGGASLLVPLLNRWQVPMRTAVAVAVACSLPIALFGSLSYLYSGWGHPLLPSYSLGYIYAPALLGIVIASTPCARIGAKVNHRLSGKRLRKSFAILLFLIGISLLAR